MKRPRSQQQHVENEDDSMNHHRPSKQQRVDTMQAAHQAHQRALQSLVAGDLVTALQAWLQALSLCRTYILESCHEEEGGPTNTNRPVGSWSSWIFRVMTTTKQQPCFPLDVLPQEQAKQHPHFFLFCILMNLAWIHSTIGQQIIGPSSNNIATRRILLTKARRYYALAQTTVVQQHQHVVGAWLFGMSLQLQQQQKEDNVGGDGAAAA